MKKGNSAKKIVQSKKPQTTNNTYKIRQPTPKPKATPNINFKDFKLQIDHEIAKCLDTLDRQGLKFLRETIRSSTLFNSGSVQEIESETKKFSNKQKQSPQKKKQSENQIQEEIDEVVEDLPQQKYENYQTKIQNILDKKNNISYQSGEKNDYLSKKPFYKKSLLKQQKQEILYFDGPANKAQKQQKNVEKQSQLNRQSQDGNEVSNIVKRIINLSPRKLQKLEKILQKLEINEEQFQQTPRQPYLFNPNQIANSSKVPRPSSKTKKSQKASSLYDNIKKEKSFKSINRSKIENEGVHEQIEEQIKPEGKQLDKSEFIVSGEKQQQNIQILGSSEPVFTNIGADNKNKLKLKFLKNQSKQFVNQKQKQYPDNNIFSSSGSSLLESKIQKIYAKNQQIQAFNSTQGKMMKIKKKGLANASNKIQFKIIGNRGHMSMVGLTSIQIYDLNGQKIQILKEKVIQPNNPKIMKLFNNINHTIDQNNMWTAVLNENKFQIQLELVQKIGGIRIWNYNKSELESTKESDYLQIIINGQKKWEGKLKKGSYNEYQDYYTQITFIDNFHIKESKNQQSINQEQNNTEAWLERQNLDQKIKQFQIQEKQINQRQKKSNKIVQRTNTLDSKYDELKISNVKKSLDFGSNNKNFQFEPKNVKIQVEIKGYDSVKRTDQINNYRDIFAEFSTTKKQANYYPQQEIMSPTKNPQNKKTIIEKNVNQPPKVQLKKKDQIHDWDQDFMNDSIFKDVVEKKISKIQQQQHRKPTPKIQQPNKKVDLDDLIYQLNDLMGSKGNNQSIVIPELPSGKTLQVIVYSNWGDQMYFGINGIQIFDDQGSIQIPQKFIGQGLQQSYQTIKRVFSGNYLTTSQSDQWKGKKMNKVSLTIQMNKKIKLSLIRIWNYNGHRVHSNRGIKNCLIKFDNKEIFQGEVRKSSGCAEDAHKFCQYILFTNDAIILKKIKQKDWISQLQIKKKEEKELFEKSLGSFQRPKTKNYASETKLQQGKIKIQHNPIKLPKRACNEYEPPLLPQGYNIRLFLHSTWGDPHFIGLNGIQIFDQFGENVLKNNSFTIFANPTSVSVLPGYENDQRQVNNLLNGINQSTLDKNIWLAPFHSDLDRLKQSQINLVAVEMAKGTKISAINIYNYAKTPERGVHQISIFVDSFLLYKGYVRKYTNQEPCHTSFIFTKDVSILEKINYLGYNEDNLKQQVGEVNEGKIIKRGGENVEKKAFKEERPLSSYIQK